MTLSIPECASHTIRGRRAGQSAEEFPPRRRRRVGERLQPPQLALPVDVGQCAQDVPREVAALGAVAAVQAKVEVVEHERFVVWPLRRRARREHDRREDLDPVGGELSMPRVAAASQPSSRALGRLPIGLTLPEPDERPRDLTRRQPIAARCLQTLMRLQSSARTPRSPRDRRPDAPTTR